MQHSGYKGMANDLNEKPHCSNVGLEEQLRTFGKCVSARHTGTMLEATATPLPPSYRPLEPKDPMHAMGVNIVHTYSLNT